MGPRDGTDSAPHAGERHKLRRPTTNVVGLPSRRYTDLASEQDLCQPQQFHCLHSFAKGTGPPPQSPIVDQDQDGQGPNRAPRPFATGRLEPTCGQSSSPFPGLGHYSRIRYCVSHIRCRQTPEQTYVACLAITEWRLCAGQVELRQIVVRCYASAWLTAKSRHSQCARRFTHQQRCAAESGRETCGCKGIVIVRTRIDSSYPGLLIRFDHMNSPDMVIYAKFTRATVEMANGTGIFRGREILERIAATGRHSSSTGSKMG